MVKIFELAVEQEDMLDQQNEKQEVVAAVGLCNGRRESRASVADRYLTAENRILRTKLPAKLPLSDTERATLAEIGKRLGRKALKGIASIAKPDTIPAWYRKLIAQKFDGSKKRDNPGRRGISKELEALVVRMARENSGWGYDRIISNLGYILSNQTVGNILKRHGIAPAPKARPDSLLEGLHRLSHGSSGRNRLFHGGAFNLARTGNLLCTLLSEVGKPARQNRGDHAASG